MCRTKLNDRFADTRQLRNAFGCFPTGVAVVTTIGRRGNPVGMTVNSFCSISLAPALLSFCVDNKAASYHDFLRCEGFTVSILNDDQETVARRFATRGADKFVGLDSIDMESDGFGPAIPGASVVFECRNYRKMPLGDHLMLIGKVEQFEETTSSPLSFVKGKFTRLQANEFTPDQVVASN